MRNRENTEKTILTAVNTLFAKNGFSGLGINAIAREAGISKVLIYRYFGSFEQLLELWAYKNSYWADQKDVVAGSSDLKETVAAIFKGFSSGLRSNPVRREVLRWLLTDDSDTARKVRERIEARGLALTRGFVGATPSLGDFDAEALTALILGGISYLVLMSDRADVYNGVPLDSKMGWDRLDRILERILDLLPV
jgi:AcrR family transcriptional regulator